MVVADSGIRYTGEGEKKEKGETGVWCGETSGGTRKIQQRMGAKLQERGETIFETEAYRLPMWPNVSNGVSKAPIEEVESSLSRCVVAEDC